MTIPGIGVASIAQFAPRTVDTNGKLSADKQAKNEAQATVSTSNTAVQISDSKATLFTSVPATTNTNKAISSRNSLTEIETNRNRFQLQQESPKPQGESAKALQSFLDVADYQRKDEMNSLYGFDIVV